MKYFIDTEFIEDFTHPLIGKSRHYIDLISIAIVAEDGREYYAISNEFNINHVWSKYQIKHDFGKPQGLGDVKEYWLRDNVLKPIWMDLYEKESDYGKTYHPTLMEWSKSGLKFLIKRYGKSQKQIMLEILQFIYDPNAEWWNEWIGSGDEYFQTLMMMDDPLRNPEFYGYYCDYDWVLFCSLFGRMLNLPKGFPMYCRDLKQMLDEKIEELSNTDFFTHFHVDTPLSFKEKLKLVKENPKYPSQSNAHNALDDARWNSRLYKFIQTL